jgi:hypothetical protein
MKIIAMTIALAILNVANLTLPGNRSEKTVEIEARFVPMISDSGDRFIKSGFSLDGHVVQIRSEKLSTYIDYIYLNGPSRGGNTEDCCVSITYEYSNGKFVMSYFAR